MKAFVIWRVAAAGCLLMALALFGALAADAANPPASRPAAASRPHDSAGESYKFAPAPPSDSVVTNTSTAFVDSNTNRVKENGTNSLEDLDEKHLLAIGDQISYRIVEDEEDPRTLTVTDSGELEVPYLGRFYAVGKSCKQVAKELKYQLEKDYYYQATVVIAVNVMTKSRGNIYLVGPVRVPGPQEIPSNENITLSKAILRAGGFTDFADTKNVKVTRQSKTIGGKDEVFIVNVEKVMDKSSAENDMPLQPGDFIHVSEKLVRF